MPAPAGRGRYRGRDALLINAANEEEYRRLANVTVRCGVCARRFPPALDEIATESPMTSAEVGPSTGGTPLGVIHPPWLLDPEDDLDKRIATSRVGEWHFSWIWHIGARARRRWVDEHRAVVTGGAWPSRVIDRRPPQYMDVDRRDGSGFLDYGPRGAASQSHYVSMPGRAGCPAVELRCHRCATRTMRPVPMSVLSRIARQAQKHGSWWTGFEVSGHSGASNFPIAMYANPKLAVWFDPSHQAPFSLEPPSEDAAALLRWPFPYERRDVSPAVFAASKRRRLTA